MKKKKWRFNSFRFFDENFFRILWSSCSRFETMSFWRLTMSSTKKRRFTKKRKRRMSKTKTWNLKNKNKKKKKSKKSKKKMTKKMKKMKKMKFSKRFSISTFELKRKAKNQRDVLNVKSLRKRKKCNLNEWWRCFDFN